MTYIPPSILNDTEFPQVEPCSCDLQTSLELINEKWELSFPEVDYFQLLRTPTEAIPEEFNSGKAGETIVDDLWGEDIPTTLTAEWVQPHSNTVVGLAADATDTQVHAPAVKLHAALQLEPTERELKKVGIDKRKAIIATIPTYMLDLNVVTCKKGDYFIWRGEQYEVLAVHDKGYWYNTNVYLYIVLDLNRRRLGS